MKSQFTFRVPTIEQVEIHQEIPSTYVIKPYSDQGKFMQLLGRLVWRVLKHTHSVIPTGITTKTMEYNTITVNSDDLVKAIFAVEDNINIYFNRGIEMIIVGRNDYRGIEEMARHMMSFQMPAHEPLYCDLRDQHRVIQIAGIPIRCVPWAEGITVVPKG